MAEPLHMLFKDAVSSVNWVSTNQELVAAIEEWGDCLTLDTEFVRTNTYYPMPGLYQIGSDETVYLLDPLSISDWQPFKDVLLDASVVKIMHACQEDSELIYHHLGVRSAGVFDTQFAQAFVSDTYSLSYANLVSQRLGVDLDKHETRSDWLQRPLSERQIEYAVEDVVYLEALYRQLSEELEEQGKLAWFLSDMTERAAYQVNEPAEYYRNIKKAWHLDAQELARLQNLCAWRETTAREENVPRNRVIWDEHLYEFARNLELDQRSISEALPRVVAKRYSDDILDVVSVPIEQHPEPIPKPLNSKQGAVVKQLKASGVAASERHGIAPELVCRKKDLEACVRHYMRFNELPDLFLDWRHDVVGADFLVMLEGTAL